jgi:hypothetical protein
MALTKLERLPGFQANFAISHRPGPHLRTGEIGQKAYYPVVPTCAFSNKIGKVSLGRRVRMCEVQAKDVNPSLDQGIDDRCIA